MNTIPLELGFVHFVGIGGIGMSGIAEVMHNLGYKVQGSDMNRNANVERLSGLGIKTFVGHEEGNVENAGVLVVSTAIKEDNPELVAARRKMIPVVRRAEMLAELMRLKWSIAVGGTHGKTTTTSMLAGLLDAADLDPTVINGGIINAYGTNARLGAGDWMVVEADESDGSFIKLPSTIAIITNIDPEHLDYWKDFDALRAAFDTFVENLPFYGFAAVCIDHPEVQSLVGRIKDRRIFTYGFSAQADIQAVNVDHQPTGSKFDVVIRDRQSDKEERLEDLFLPMVGDHNILNSLSLVAVAIGMKLKNEVVRKAISSFGGVKRRFTHVGTGAGITVIDDYGHHPVEIAAVLKAARQASRGKVVAVVQPHRYSRLQNLFEEFCTCFNDADTVIVSDIFGAGEQPIEGASRDDLVDGLLARGHRHAIPLEAPESLAATVLDVAGPDDMVVCLGAGSITQWANALPQALQDQELQALQDQEAKA